MLIVYRIKGNINKNFSCGRELKKSVSSLDKCSKDYNVDNQSKSKMHVKKKEGKYGNSKNTESELNIIIYNNGSDSSFEDQNHSDYNKQNCQDKLIYQDNQNYKDFLCGNNLGKDDFDSPIVQNVKFDNMAISNGLFFN